jgi:hypothetical protein
MDDLKSLKLIGMNNQVVSRHGELSPVALSRVKSRFLKKTRIMKILNSQVRFRQGLLRRVTSGRVKSCQGFLKN